MTRGAAAIVLAGSLLTSAACARSDSSSPTARTDATPVTAPVTAPDEPDAPSTTAPPPPSGTGRPFRVFVPSSYDGSTAVPLVVSLHGFTSSGEVQERYFDLEAVAEDRGLLAVHPDGTFDALGFRFWNATEACCNFTGSPVDDSTYLADLIDEVAAGYRVDPARVYVIGFSNGGFMSHRMACDHADRIAAIASLAGAMWTDPARCSPSEPVNVLQIHGTDDETIAYDGGTFWGREHPSVATTTGTWAGLNGCEPREPAPVRRHDLVADLDGDETAVGQFAGCPAGGAVEVWTMEGASHLPVLAAGFTGSLVDFLLSHPKP